MKNEFNYSLPNSRRVIDIVRKDGFFHSTVPDNPSNLDDYHLFAYGGQGYGGSDVEFIGNVKVNPTDTWSYTKEESISKCPICYKPVAMGLCCSHICHKIAEANFNIMNLRKTIYIDILKYEAIEENNDKYI